MADGIGMSDGIGIAGMADGIGMSDGIGIAGMAAAMAGWKPGARPGKQIVATARTRHATPTNRENASPFRPQLLGEDDRSEDDHGTMLIAPRASRTTIRPQQQPRQ